MTPADRGDLAERMLPVAAQLAAVVHGDGGARDVEHALAGLDRQDLTALTVVLAGLVDPDRPVRDALAWVTWDEHGRPVPPPTDRRPVRQHARPQWTPVGYPCPARSAAVADGAPAAAVAARFGVAARTVSRWRTAAGAAS